MQQEIIEIIKKHIRLSNIDGIMLTGSHADGSQSKESDIDIVIISKLVSRQTHENIIWKNKMYQFIIFPYRKIIPLLYDDLQNKKWIFISMFAKGVILLDPTGIIQQIKNFSYSYKFPI